MDDMSDSPKSAGRGPDRAQQDIGNRAGIALLLSGQEQAIKDLPVPCRLHFPIPLGLVLPKLVEESEEEYQELTAFVKGGRFNANLASRHDWANRLQEYGALLIRFMSQRAALDNVLAMAFSVRPAPGKDNPAFISNIQFANTAVLMSGRSGKDEIEADASETNSNSWGNNFGE